MESKTLAYTKESCKLGLKLSRGEIFDLNDFLLTFDCYIYLLSSFIKFQTHYMEDELLEPFGTIIK